MIANDERRAIAARLREGGARLMVFDCELAHIVAGDVFCDPPCDDCRKRAFYRLADLIEPDDHIADSGEKVDRGALLALADEMDGWDGGEVVGGAPGLWADTIREALGVVEP